MKNASRSLPFRTLTGMAVVLLTLAVLPSILYAQAASTGAATGTVFDLRTGFGLGGVTVTVDGTKLKTTTADDGTFRIEGVPPGERVFRLRTNAYTTVIERALIDAGWTSSFDVGMAPMFAMLEALSVEVGIGSLIGDSLTGSSRIRGADMEQDENAFRALARVPGVKVSWPGGVVGRGARIEIRGLSSMMLSNNPTFYLDGVRVGPTFPVFDNTGGGTVYYNLDFIEPHMIDRIEVLRGPATAFRYGSSAAAGVIMVYSKR